MVVAIRNTARGMHTVRAYAEGSVIWEFDTEYVFPASGWVPTYQPVLVGAAGPSQRVYFAGPVLQVLQNRRAD